MGARRDGMTKQPGQHMWQVPFSGRKGDGLGRGSRGMRGAGSLRGTACLLVMGGIRRGPLGDFPSPRGLGTLLYAGGGPVSMPWGSSGVRYWLLASFAAPCRGLEARAEAPRGAGTVAERRPSCSGLQTVARGLANKGRFQLTFCANMEPRQSAPQMCRRVNAKKDGPRTVRALSCRECGPHTVDCSPRRLIAGSEADNPVLGRWIEADNSVPKIR